MFLCCRRIGCHGDDGTYLSFGWKEREKNTTEKHRERSVCVFISLDLDLFFNPQSKKKATKRIRATQVLLCFIRESETSIQSN